MLSEMRVVLRLLKMCLDLINRRMFSFKLNDSIVNVGLPQNHSQNRLEHMAKLASGSY